MSERGVALAGTAALAFGIALFTLPQEIDEARRHSPPLKPPPPFPVSVHILIQLPTLTFPGMHAIWRTMI